MTQFHNNDDRFMRAALLEARKGLGKTSPNPAVGAVVVCEGKIIARGHHRQSGAPHAEIECLAKVPRSQLTRSILYATLEPCSTKGRTGACTTAIVQSGIRTVVVGAIDPNPRHRGKGLKILEAAGIQVRQGILADECVALNEAFNKWIVTKRPFVIAKCGMSLDGRLSRPPGELQWLTGAAARQHARGLRAVVDAILVGAETVRKDNPRLTVRGIHGARQPWRVILTRSGQLPRHARLFTDRYAAQTVVYRRKLLHAVLDDLGRRQITSVLIEGGGEILSEALDRRLIDKIEIYVGPILSGGPIIAFAGSGAASTAQSARLENVAFTRVGETIWVSGYPKFGGFRFE